MKLMAGSLPIIGIQGDRTQMLSPLRHWSGGSASRSAFVNAKGLVSTRVARRRSLQRDDRLDGLSFSVGLTLRFGIAQE